LSESRAVFRLNLPDALFELIDGAAVGFVLFAGLCSELIVLLNCLLELLLKFLRVLLEAGEMSVAFAFDLLDALFKLFDDAAVGFVQFAGLRRELIVLLRCFLELLLKIYCVLLEAGEILVTFAFDLADALFELVDGVAMGLGLFVGLRRDSVVQNRSPFELSLKFV
jgi:hypothetical protein